MTRQQNITLLQVESKMHEAKHRAKVLGHKLYQSNSDEEHVMHEINKAINDYKMWSYVRLHILYNIK